MRRPNCGSDWGYRLHLKHGEPACLPCLDAHRDAWKQWRDNRYGARELKPCGTRAAYKRHLRRREPVCWRCRLANRHGRDFVGTEAVAA